MEAAGSSSARRSDITVHACPEPRTRASASPEEHDDDRGSGWVLFAGLLLLMLGTLNFIEGIAAVGNSHFFIVNARYLVGSLSAWGWVLLCVGVIEWFVGLAVSVNTQSARWCGVIVLGLNAVVQLLAMPACPFWAVPVFTLDVLAMYGLVAFGQRLASAGP